MGQTAFVLVHYSLIWSWSIDVSLLKMWYLLECKELFVKKNQGDLLGKRTFSSGVGSNIP